MARDTSVEIQEQVNLFLDDLRESGVVNMFGASSFVQEEFDVNRSEAKNYLTAWMDTFAERHKVT